MAWVSFCYEDALDETVLRTQTQHLEHLQSLSAEALDKITIGVDRGITRPVQAGDLVFDFSEEQKKKAKEKYIKRYQKRLSSMKKGSKRWKNTKRKISHEKIGNIRKDFCHNRTIIEQKEVKVIEDLRIKQMTAKSKIKQDPTTNKWLKNNRAAKAGLNRAILDKGWFQLENYLKSIAQVRLFIKFQPILVPATLIPIIARIVAYVVVILIMPQLEQSN
jgi:putative transposase